MSERRTVSVKDIESLLICLPDIQKARVVVNDWGAIEEIHILTGLGRNPKQIVRDVQSALKAQWDITVDRRKVSVAQVQAGMPEASGRLRYVGLEVKTDARTGKNDIVVTLDRAIEKETASYVGKSVADSTEVSTLLGVARATCLAGNLTLEAPNAFFVDDATALSIGQYRAVAVLIDLLTPRRNQEQMVGCALVKRDIREACVRATLDAMNRRMEVLPQKAAGKPPEKGEAPATGEDADMQPRPHEEPTVATPGKPALPMGGEAAAKEPADDDDNVPDLTPFNPDARKPLRRDD